MVSARARAGTPAFCSCLVVDLPTRAPESRLELSPQPTTGHLHCESDPKASYVGLEG